MEHDDAEWRNLLSPLGDQQLSKAEKDEMLEAVFSTGQRRRSKQVRGSSFHTIVPFVAVAFIVLFAVFATSERRLGHNDSAIPTRLGTGIVHSQPVPPPPVTLPNPSVVHSNPTVAKTVEFQHVAMLDSNSGWAIGGTATQGGRVLRTRDGGATWTDVSPPVVILQYGFRATDFASESTAYCVVTIGTDPERAEPVELVMTVDGGQTWHIRRLPGTGVPIEIHFDQPDRGWIATNAGEIWRTNDGGAIWTPQTPQAADPRMPVAFSDEAHGIAWAAQNKYEAGVLALDKTTDGGWAWTTQLIPVPTNYHSKRLNIESIRFFNPKDGVVSVNSFYFNGESEGGGLPTSGFLMVTHDGGVTWRMGLPIQYELNGSGLFGIADLLDVDHAFMMCGRALYFTSDSGQHWHSVVLDRQVKQPIDYDFVSPTVGWVVSNDGTLLKTTNGGVSFNPVSTNR